jgi:septum formation protein
MIIEYADHLASKAIVLASASPRRREILGLLQLPFTVNVSNFEETLAKASFKTPAAYAVANATGKAREVASRETDADLVIGSDTIVVLDGAILEKPRSEGESYAMLKSLSGRSHTVISAIALFLKGSCVGAAWEAAEPAVARAVTTEVTFSELSDVWRRLHVSPGRGERTGISARPPPLTRVPCASMPRAFRTQYMRTYAPATRGTRREAMASKASAAV